MNTPLKDLETRIASLETKVDKLDFVSIPIEQYKILFNVIINLNDNVVKSILTIFLIFSAIIALVLKGIADDIPEVKDALYINYALIFFFFYYICYLRFRIRAMFEIAEKIEKIEGFKYHGIAQYQTIITRRFFSTKGLFVIVITTLLFINTWIIIILE